MSKNETDNVALIFLYQCEKHQKIQLNFFKADMLFNGHLSIADTVLKSGWNHGHFLVKTLSLADRSSEHLSIADSHYSSRFIKKFQCFCIIRNLERKLNEKLLDKKFKQNQIQLLKVKALPTSLIDFPTWITMVKILQ